MVNRDWDSHWSNRFVNLNVVFNFYRKHIMSNALSYFFEKYFPEKGIFVECGSGTSMTSYSLKKKSRRLVALDISPVAIKEARESPNIDYFVEADALRLPFRSNSIDGIWNLGVMEHFTQKQIDQGLQEFKRVLKGGSYVIMFWPPVYSSTGMVYRFIERLIFLATRKEFRFYPDEISRLKSKKQAKNIMKRNNFHDCHVYFPWRNCFGDLVVVARK